MNPMANITRRFALAALLGTALAAVAPLAQAQAYPNRPIRLLVGYSPGGGVDSLARLLAQRLTVALGQQVIVENRSGASGMIAAETVAKSAPDGYTLLMGETGMLVTSLLQPRPGVDPIKSFTPVAGAFVAPLMVVAHSDFPANNPKELIALLKAHPGKYSYGTSGVGTLQHLGFEMMKARSNAFIVHIPYRGAAQILTDVNGGQVPIGIVSAAGGLAQTRSGRIKAIAMMDTSKLPGTDNIPRMADALPGFDVAPRLMLLAPAGTPAAIVEKLDEVTRTVLATPEVSQAAAQQGGIPAYVAPARLGATMAKESTDWAAVIKAQKLTME